MPEFVIDDVTYRTRRLSAVQEWRLYMHCNPVLGHLVTVEAEMQLRGAATSLPYALQALSGMDDDALLGLYAEVRGICERNVDAEWVAVDQEMPLSSLLSLVVAASTMVLGDFLSFKRTQFRPMSRDFAGFEPVVMNDNKQWLFRPASRHCCAFKDLYDGTVSLAQVAEWNDFLDVADENEYRARKAAESEAQSRARSR